MNLCTGCFFSILPNQSTIFFSLLACWNKKIWIWSCGFLLQLLAYSPFSVLNSYGKSIQLYSNHNESLATAIMCTAVIATPQLIFFKLLINYFENYPTFILIWAFFSHDNLTTKKIVCGLCDTMYNSFQINVCKTVRDSLEGTDIPLDHSIPL